MHISYIYILCLYAGSKIRTSKGKGRHHNLSCWTSRFGIPLNTYCIHCLDALELSQAVQGMLFVGNNGNDDSSAKAIKEPLRICCRNMLKLSHERLLVCAIIRQSYGDLCMCPPLNTHPRCEDQFPSKGGPSKAGASLQTGSAQESLQQGLVLHVSRLLPGRAVSKHKQRSNCTWGRNQCRSCTSVRIAVLRVGESGRVRRFVGYAWVRFHEERHPTHLTMQSWFLAHCLFTDMEAESPCYIPPNLAAGLDYFSIGTLLQAAMGFCWWFENSFRMA